MWLNIGQTVGSRSIFPKKILIHEHLTCMHMTTNNLRVKNQEVSALWNVCYTRIIPNNLENYNWLNEETPINVIKKYFNKM